MHICGGVKIIVEYVYSSLYACFADGGVAKLLACWIIHVISVCNLVPKSNVKKNTIFLLLYMVFLLFLIKIFFYINVFFHIFADIKFTVTWSQEIEIKTSKLNVKHENVSVSLNFDGYESTDDIFSFLVL